VERSLKKVIVCCDEIFLFIFTVEMIVKWIAMGLLCGKLSYLRDKDSGNWNKLDMIVVCSGWVSLILAQSDHCSVHGILFCAEAEGGSTKFSALRSIRVLRPLRTINRFPGMKIIVQTLLASLPQLLDSIVLFGFVLVLFGVMGLQLYMGVFLQQCVTQLGDGRYSVNMTEGEPTLCSLDDSGWNGFASSTCPVGMVCRENVGENPNSGVTAFDDIFHAILTVFQCITLEGWVDIMYNVRETKGLGNDIYIL
jgi:voltage-dependent calcium channel L type alpha-1F